MSDIKNAKVILIIAAHPDDEVLGCFGTVARLIKEGYTAYTLILSRGKTSRGDISDSEMKQYKNEMINANNLIGIKKVYQADFPDNKFDSVPLLDIVQKIEEIKKIISPEIIFTHHIGDINIDHQITHKAVLTATRPMIEETVTTIYAMEVPSSTEWNSYSKDTIFTPNVFFDISETIKTKIKAMEEYNSELKKYPHPRSLQHIEELARLYGSQIGINSCERFILIRGIYK